MREIIIKSKVHNYTVNIDESLCKLLSSEINVGDRLFVIFDKHVDSKYLHLIEASSNNVSIFTVNGGEDTKTLENYAKVISQLLENDFSKKDILLAVGGGCTLDLAGYVASTYKRGIRYISCPSTLLAMVDASIGGKNAINIDGVKNVIGTIYPPEKILIGFDVLSTLSTLQIHNGIYEIIKIALVANGSLFETLKKSFDQIDLNDLIIEAIMTKKAIVEKDEFESSCRKILNFGHTIGHALESIEEYSLSHGEAIANGMLIISKNEAYFKDLQRILMDMNCNIIKKYNCDKLIEFIKNDKKAYNGYIDLVVVHSIGNAEIVPTKITDIFKGE